jgi:hypothetical protein
MIRRARLARAVVVVVHAFRYVALIFTPSILEHFKGAARSAFGLDEKYTDAGVIPAGLIVAG